MEEKKWVEINPQDDTHDFEETPVLEGVYVKRDDDVGPNKSKLYHIESNGEIVKVWGCTTLDARMGAVDKKTREPIIGLGAEVRIELKNKVPNRFGNETKIFSVKTVELPEDEKPE